MAIEDGIKEALENGTLYDFVANNYYLMSKEQLKELILNLDFVATYHLPETSEKAFYAEVKEELENIDFFSE